ncbi:MAG: hypothetical protein ACYSWX_12025 [Planctomycetota bacterium]|jgi:hypothetical protein
MRFSMLLAAPLIWGCLATTTVAQVGQSIPEDIELENFGNSPAKSFEDFRGRTVLIEFFAYW